MAALPIAHVSAPETIGAPSIAVYGAAVVLLEIAAIVASPTVAEIGYAVLVLVLVNHVALTVLRPGSDSAPHTGLLIVLAIPLVLRLASLTLEGEPAVAVRHYAVIGAVAVTAALCAFVVFPDVRPRLRLPAGGRYQVVIALAGIPLGLALALVFARASLVPQQGHWQSTRLLLALLVGAAVTEELLFRGILQDALQRPFGWAAPLVGTAALTLVYLNVRPVGFVFVALALGLASAIVVSRTGSIHGVVVGRVLLLVGLVYAWPRILDLH